MGVPDIYTISLLHFDGADGSTTITDESGKSWLVTNQAQIDTAQSVFGGASLLSDGVGDYVRNAINDADFAFPNGTDFTIEFWFRLSGAATSKILYDCRPAENGWYITLAIDANNKLYFLTAADVKILSTTVPQTNTWYHLALARSGTNTKLFLNGLQEGSTYINDTASYLNSNLRPLLMSGYNGASYSVPGWMDELRISKGICRYTSDFVLPARAFGKLTGGIINIF